MKVYTIQPVDFLQSVDSEGFIFPRKYHAESSVFFDNPNAIGVHFVGLKKSIRNESSYHWIEI